jgi:hypothetical protein
MKYWYVIGALILWIGLGGFTACGGKEAVDTGTLTWESSSFLLAPYDDSATRGDSSITLHRETLRDEKGEDETVWTARGKVTKKYEYGYAGVAITPDDKTLARLQSDAETIKLRISGDGRRYRVSVETENVTDGNNFGMEITAPKRTEEIVIPIAGLKQENGWGRTVMFDRTMITRLKIQTIGQPSSFRFILHRIEIL